MSSLQRCTILIICTLCLLGLTGGAFAAAYEGFGTLTTAADTLANDTWESGQPSAFQGGFIAGEMAAVRLDPHQPGSFPLNNVHFLFGGATSMHEVRLHIWQDTGGSVPGAEIFTADYVLTGSDSAWQMIDLSLENIIIDGTFRVGLEFTHSGYPSVTRDNDGINTGRNFIYASDGNWYDSALFGLAGDWVIRAVLDSGGPGEFTVGGSVTGLSGTLVLQNNGADDLTINSDGPFTFNTPLADGSSYAVTVLAHPAGQTCSLSFSSGTINGVNITSVTATCANGPTSETIQNDGWEEGQNANFQSGFVAGEIAASRLLPSLSGPQPLTNVHFLFGGEETLQTITLHIWQDDTGGDTPGTEIFSSDYALWGSNEVWHEIDLSTEGIVVDGGFRVGIEFQHSGVPSVARDNDGIIPDRNYIFASDGTWYESSLLGLPGDWIIRASIGDGVIVGTSPVLSSITDIPNDQGRSVRLVWMRASFDAQGSLHPISEYAVFRRQDNFRQGDDQSRLSGWDFISTVPAFGEDIYQCLAPTLCDSTVDGGVCWSVFMIRAMTGSQYDFYDSAPDSGYSVDNLAPNEPAGFMVAYGPINSLTWEPADDPDFRYFKIYRGNQPDFEIDPAQPVATTADPQWLDQDGQYDSYYLISSVDFAGNESATAAPASTTAVDDLQVGKSILLGNVPNPFNPQTTISFELAHEGAAHLAVFDVSGRLVRTLLAGEIRTAGRHDQLWNGLDDSGKSVATGVYFYHLKVDGFEQTRRMALIK
jgi:hypothetical protein